MIIVIILNCHVVGTAFHMLGKMEEYYGVEDNWLAMMNVVNSSWYVRYTEAFYWALASFLLVGSKGFTTYETVFTTFILLSTICSFAYILQTI